MSAEDLDTACRGYFPGAPPASPPAASGSPWVADSTAVAAVAVRSPTLPPTASITGAAPSMMPLADSLTPCTAVAADSPIEPRSTGSPGISIPVASFTPMRAFLIASHMRASFRLDERVFPQQGLSAGCPLRACAPSGFEAARVVHGSPAWRLVHGLLPPRSCLAHFRRELSAS